MLWGSGLWTAPDRDPAIDQIAAQFPQEFASLRGGQGRQILTHWESRYWQALHQLAWQTWHTQYILSRTRHNFHRMTTHTNLRMHAPLNGLFFAR